MTKTVTFPITLESAVDVSLQLVDQASLSLVEELTTKSGMHIANYVYTVGDPSEKTTVSVRNSGPSSDVQSNTMLMRTQCTVSEDGKDDIVSPVEISITINGPVLPELSALSSLVGAAFGLTFNGVTSKVRNTGNLAKLNRGLITKLFS